MTEKTKKRLKRVLGVTAVVTVAPIIFIWCRNTARERQRAEDERKRIIAANNAFYRRQYIEDSLKWIKKFGHLDEKFDEWFEANYVNTTYADYPDYCYESLDD